MPVRKLQRDDIFFRKSVLSENICRYFRCKGGWWDWFFHNRKKWITFI